MKIINIIRNSKTLNLTLLIIAVTIFFGCDNLGKKYSTFTVISTPPGATVYTLIDNKISWKFTPMEHGETPLSETTIHFGFGNPLAGDTKIGVRLEKSGYETKEIFFKPSDWYETADEARKNVVKISVTLINKKIQIKKYNHNNCLTNKKT